MPDVTPTAPAVCWAPGCITIGCESHPRPRKLSGHRQGYGAAWRRRRALFLAKHPDCAHCGVPAVDVDHIVPRRQGGGEDERNLQGLCRSCHSRKTVTQDGGFREYR